MSEDSCAQAGTTFVLNSRIAKKTKLWILGNVRQRKRPERRCKLFEEIPSQAWFIILPPFFQLLNQPFRKPSCGSCPKPLGAGNTGRCKALFIESLIAVPKFA